jgi:5'-phosphate synthase pdxT subunit
MDVPVVGVLALQGAFAKHIAMLHSLKAKAIEVRTPDDLAKCDALIIPGGESSVIKRQLGFIAMEEAMVKFAHKKPVFGTCAGLILMSREIVGGGIVPMNLLDISVERNAFGRQVESFKTDLQITLKPGQPKLVPAIFIRAPRIRSIGSDVKILAEFGGEPVMVQQGMHLACSFHPELTDDKTIHTYFLRQITK